MYIILFKIRRFVFTFFTLIFAINSYSQIKIEGYVSHKGKPLPFSIVRLQNGLGSTTNTNGYYIIKNVKVGIYQVEAKHTGYKTVTKKVEIKPADVIIKLDFDMEEDILNLNQTIVSASKKEVIAQNAPVVVNRIDKKLFENVQALNLSEGLSFSPGLRVENNCQNCGFTQVRMNGLDGPYSQILINSRPIFSALASVYGLEMLPASMIDRVEIVRGGGSVLYGGNAIAGTVNIITKDPITNNFDVSYNQAFIGLKTPENTINFDGSVVSDDLQSGVTFFGFNRNREAFDANNDGFSELTKIKNQSFGFDAFLNTGSKGKLKFGVYTLNEFRRGGNKFEAEPHQADVAEQLKHNIIGANIAYDFFFNDYKHKLSVYNSVQHINRNSYYGGGGRFINPNDTLTQVDLLALNAYGNSEDLAMATGIQFSGEIFKKISQTSGVEWQINKVNDKMPGYQRNINQQVSSLGFYNQLEYKLVNRFTLLAGLRYDAIFIKGFIKNIDDKYYLDRNMEVWVPRVSMMYDLNKHLKLRTSYAQGYRAPQAFNEDLHVETVGGAARFIVFDQNLITEKSESYTLSFNYNKTNFSNQQSYLIEGFFTNLKNPFVLGNQTEMPNGVALITKRNGKGAIVYGINAETNYALGRKFLVQAGLTIQKAIFKEDELIWQSKDTGEKIQPTFTRNMLRTPNWYGFASVTYQIHDFSVTYSGVYTGKMQVAHVINPQTEQTIIKQTPIFFEHNLKLNYTVFHNDSYNLTLFSGIQNIFNSYQKDFDTGPLRDAGYVYGPLRPRTVYMGLKIGFGR
ncbi:MAG: TonB-dependent receptor [Bacteroidia bacterium]